MMLLSLLGLALVAVLAAFLSITAYLHYQHRRFAHLPRPEPFNFYFGHFSAIKNVIKNGKPLDILFIDWYYQYGPVFVVYIFHHHRVIFLDPKHTKEIVMNPNMYKPGMIYKKLGYVWGERFLGKGLLTEPHYEVWKPRRSLYDPSFSKVHLKTLIPAFNECVDRMVEKLTPLADGVTLVPMKKEFSIVTLGVISKRTGFAVLVFIGREIQYPVIAWVAFGSDFQSWCSNISELKKEGVDGEGELLGLLKHIMEAIEISFYYLFFEYFHPSKTQSYRTAVQAIRKIGRECVQHRISAIENGEPVRNDILTQIIKVTRTDDNITLEDLVDDFATFYIAGQETTSNLLSFALVLMLQHPHVLSRVVDEVTDVFGDCDVVTWEDVEKLEYTLQVLQETLRLYPPVPGSAKAAAEEIVIGGHRIPKDAHVITSTFAACRLAENFEDPEKFDPSRFSPDRPKPDPFVYSPFARGHRSCIGQVFALIEARIILARLLQKFQFSLPADFKLEMEARGTLQPKGHIPCTLKLVHEE